MPAPSRLLPGSDSQGMPAGCPGPGPKIFQCESIFRETTSGRRRLQKQRTTVPARSHSTGRRRRQERWLWTGSARFNQAAFLD